MTASQTTTRRQLPQNFAAGDKVRVTTVVEGKVLATEQTYSGDWLLTVQATEMKTVTSEANSASNTEKRERQVLWGVTAGGEVELIVEAGANQRIVALGVPAKAKQSLRETLAGLSAAEAESLLKEIVEDTAGTSPSVPNGVSTGHLASGTKANSNT